jgi:dolichyl-phosphate-mannose-protein mannosyltransferase
LTATGPAGDAPSRPDRYPWWRAALWVAVAIGVALRLRRFLGERSLWGDETLVASNLVSRSWRGLLEPLDLGQAAPVGFLWLEKLVVTGFGASELALRAPPLLAGTAALLLFRRVAAALLAPAAALFAVVFFALAEPQVAYSATVKQYAFDVLCALLLFDRALALLRPARPARRDWVLLVVAGLVAQLFSHAAILLEGAVVAVLLFERRREAAWRERLAPLAVGAAWLALFALTYGALLRDAANNPYLKEFWGNSYAPFPPRSAADLQWYATRLAGYLSDPLAATPAALAAGVVLAGLLLGRERGGLRLLLAGPLVVALLASMAGCYPFLTGLDEDLGSGRFNWNGRLLLFTTPGVVLLAAEGLRATAGRFAVVGRAAAMLAGAALLVVPAIDATRNFVAPPRLQEIGPAVAFLRDRLEPGDAEFLRDAAQPSYRYYARRLGVDHPFETFDLIDDAARGDFRRRVAELPLGRRLWVFYVEGLSEGPEIATNGVMTGVGRAASLRDAFESERVHVWLFVADGGESWRRGRRH